MPGKRADPSSRLDKLEQAAKIFATVLAPIVLGIGGWVVQSAIERGRENIDKQRISLEYVKMAKGILTSDKAPPRALTRWSWELINAVSPRPFDPEDLQRVLAGNVTIPSPSGSAGPAVSEDRLMPIDEVNRRVSPAAILMMVEFEVGSRTYYEKHFMHPSWPGGASGVTIGIDYDLGYTSIENLRKDWLQSNLRVSQIDRLAKVVGINGPDAKPWVKELSNITITWDDAFRVFTFVEIRRWATLVDRNIPNASLLPPSAFGALVSLTFNRGLGGFTSPKRRYTEMRNIYELMEKKQFAEIPNQILAMKRLWPNIKGLQIRRDREAQLFAKDYSGRSAAASTSRN